MAANLLEQVIAKVTAGDKLAADGIMDNLDVEYPNTFPQFHESMLWALLYNRLRDAAQTHANGMVRGLVKPIAYCARRMFSDSVRMDLFVQFAWAVRGMHEEGCEVLLEAAKTFGLDHITDAQRESLTASEQLLLAEGTGKPAHSSHRQLESYVSFKLWQLTNKLESEKESEKASWP